MLWCVPVWVGPGYIPVKLCEAEVDRQTKTDKCHECPSFCHDIITQYYQERMFTVQGDFVKTCTFNLKGIVLPKLKFHPFSTHHYVDEGDIFLIHITAQELHRRRGRIPPQWTTVVAVNSIICHQTQVVLK